MGMRLGSVKRGDQVPETKAWQRDPAESFSESLA